MDRRDFMKALLSAAAVAPLAGLGAKDAASAGTASGARDLRKMKTPDLEERFGHCGRSWVAVQGVGWNEARCRFGLAGFSKNIVAELLGEGEAVRRVELPNCNSAGFVEFTGLTPKKDYRFRLTADAECAEAPFRTLAAPRTPKLFSVALLADPHLSQKQENRNGRLFVESGMLFQQALQEAAGRCDLVAIPGDITNASLPGEYQMAKELLDKCPLPKALTPGNHDVKNGGDRLYAAHFGAGAWLREFHGWQLAALDTAEACLDTPGNRAVIDALDVSRPVLFFSHYQFFADKWIRDKDKAIADAKAARPLLEKIGQCRGVAYIGHKNLAASVRRGHLLQMNLPQIVHFPCGHVEAEVHEDGIWHRFRPIASEALNEYSRLGAEAGLHAPFYCQSAYRDAYSLPCWNQVVKVAAK